MHQQVLVAQIAINWEGEWMRGDVLILDVGDGGSRRAQPTVSSSSSYLNHGYPLSKLDIINQHFLKIMHLNFLSPCRIPSRNIKELRTPS